MQPTLSILFFSKSLNLFIPFFYFRTFFFLSFESVIIRISCIISLILYFFRFLNMSLFVSLYFSCGLSFFSFPLSFSFFFFFYSFSSICLFLLLIFNSVSLSIYFWHSLFSYWPRNWFRGKFLLISQFKMDFKMLADLFPEILF